MQKFLSTACRYMAGQSGLPSSLPARSSVDLAKEKSRKLRLLCKGLENFCEILYKEPEDESKDSAAVTQSQDSSASTISNSAIAESASEQKQNLPDATDTVTEMTDNKAPVTAAVATPDQQLPEPTDAVTEMVASRKAHTHVLTPGEDLFKSLFATEKTPPTTPGSVASSGTLIDPSSRKVSPLDLATLGKDSPTAVKDFAYPSPDSVRIDPVAMIEEETKKGLLRQLKKKITAEEKASRKSEKMAARNNTLSAELKSAKATVQNRDAQADLAKVHANAMTVSNVVLRQLIKDISHRLNRENNGTQANGIPSEGEKKWGQHKEESLQEHLRGVDESSASAYGRMALLENALAVRGQNLDNTFSGKSVPQENPSPTDEDVESKESGSSVVQPPAQQASEESQTGVVLSTSFTGTSEETQPETTVEASEVRPKEKAEGFEKYNFQPAELSRIVSSVTPTADEASEEKDTEEVTPEKEAVQEVEEHKVDTMADEAISNALREYQQRDLNLGEESAAGRIQATPDPIAADFDDATPNQEESREFDGEDQVSEADEDTSPSTAEHLNSGSAHDEEPVTQEPIADPIPNHNQVQDVAEGFEGATHENYEFSEPAGPATLWGILQSSQNENEAKDGVDARDDTSTSTAERPISGSDCAEEPITQEPIDDATRNSDQVQATTEGREDDIYGQYSSSEPAGPATLWGILQSDHSENDATGVADASDDAASVSEPADPATLGGTPQLDQTEKAASNQNENDPKDTADAGQDTAGVLEATVPFVQSSQSEEKANDNADAVEDAAGTPDAAVPPNEAGPASLWGPPRSKEVEKPVEDQEVDQEVAGDEAVDVSDEEAPGRARFSGILISDPQPSIDDSRATEVSENVRMNGDVVLEHPDSSDVSGFQDQVETEPFSLPHDTTTLNTNEDTDGLHDTKDNEEEPSDPTITPTVDEITIPDPNDSTDRDESAIQEFEVQEVKEVIAEEAMGTIRVESPADTVDTVADPIGGSKDVEVSELEVEDGATEAVHLHETTTILVDPNTPVGAADNLNEYASNATLARKEDQGEQVAEKANASRIAASPEVQKDNNEREDVPLAEKDAVLGTSPLQTAMAEDEEGPKEVQTPNGSSASGNLQATCEEYEDTDDHKLPDMANGSSSISAEGTSANGVVIPADTLTPPSTSSTTPRAFSPFHVEKFEFFGPVPKPKEVTKTEKRRQERKRAAAKKAAEKAAEEALRRHMEEEAANSPEAIAQREAEELKMLGEKRLKLQQARMETAARVAEEQARLGQLSGR